jgi:hypothetical protein
MNGPDVCLNWRFNFYLMQEHRVWFYGDSVPSALTPQYIWDAGGEVWEMTGGEIRHYRVIDRVFLNKEMTRMKETLERMEESAIPKEIYAKHTIKGKWQIEPVAPEESAHGLPAVWELTSLAHWIPSTVLLPLLPLLPLQCDLSRG